MNINLEINSCRECPFYTENMFYSDYKCSKADVSFSSLKNSYDIQSWTFGVPDFCPFKKFVGVGIAGKAHSGKTYLANKIKEVVNFPVTILKFADPLYFYLQAIKQQKDREFLIKLADLTKKYFGDNIFVNTLQKQIQDKRSIVFIVVDDVRYEAEAKMLKKEGFFLIYLDTPDEIRKQRAATLNMPFIEEHPSESGVAAVADFANVVVSSSDFNIVNVLKSVNWVHQIW